MYTIVHATHLRANTLHFLIFLTSFLASSFSDVVVVVFVVVVVVIVVAGSYCDETQFILFQ